MKKSLITLVLLASSFGASAVIIDRSATDTKDITFSGEIPAVCRVDTHETAMVSALDLSTHQAQAVGEVLVWCNTASRDADVTYTSLNNGAMVDEHNHRIDYVIDLSGGVNNVSLSSAKTLQQMSGRNNPHASTQGDAIATTLSISPLVTGYEYAGTYSDTITIDVAARN